MGKDDKEKSEATTIAVGVAQIDNVQQQGEAASQIIQAKKGLRVNSAGQLMEHHGRSLDQVSNYSTGTGTSEQQARIVKSQAGFSAELIEESRYNKNAILEGSSNRRRTTDGIGRTNDTKYDHVVVDKKGNVILGSESQMKFYGIDEEGRYKVIEKIVNDPSWSRYDGRPIDIPSDQYEGAVGYANKCAKDYRNQAQRLLDAGKADKAGQLTRKAEQYEKAAKAVRKSNVSSTEAIEARTNPDLFAIKEVTADANHAGLGSAKSAVVVCGAISMTQNLYAVISGEKEIEEAADDVIRTSVNAGVTTYVTTAGGTAIKAVLHSSMNEQIRDLGNTSFPLMVAMVITETGKSMKKYISGEINEEELLLELGEKGTGMLAAEYGFASGMSAGAMIGSVVPGIGTAAGIVAGGIIGSMLGSNVGSILYRGAIEALQGERISEERKKVVELIAQKAIEENKKYQILMEQYARANYYQREYRLKALFQQMDSSLMNDDMDAYVQSLEGLGDVFGIKLKFESFDEFDDFMGDQDSILVLN